MKKKNDGSVQVNLSSRRFLDYFHVSEYQPLPPMYLETLT